MSRWWYCRSVDADSASVKQKTDLSTENAAVLLGLRCICGSKVSTFREQRSFCLIMDRFVDQMYL